MAPDLVLTNGRFTTLAGDGGPVEAGGFVVRAVPAGIALAVRARLPRGP